MTALDVEIAVMKYLNPRQNIIVPNVSWGLHNEAYKALHECDLLSLTGSNWASEIEIKVSKADLLKDAEKRHGHFHNLIRRFYFAVPEAMKDFALDNIPVNAGLIVVGPREVNKYGRDQYGGYVIIGTTSILRSTLIRECKINTNAVRWTNEQRFQLARLGTMRILGLKEKINKLKQ